MWAQAELRKVLGLMGARVVDAELALGHAHTRLVEPDAELRERLAETLRLLAAEAQPPLLSRSVTRRRHSAGGTHGS